jgi:hypothetical protein
MRTKQAHAQPARLEEVRRRFERWRRSRKALSRIPEPLWAAAVKAAGVAGISRTAKTLRVNHHALKLRIAEAAATAVEPEGGPVATFLELAPPTRTGACQCTLELEDACGAKMRVHLQSDEAPDLAALSRSFWELRS